MTDTCPGCGHSVDDHFFYNENGLLTVGIENAVLLACQECDCRTDTTAGYPRESIRAYYADRPMQSGDSSRPNARGGDR